MVPRNSFMTEHPFLVFIVEVEALQKKYPYVCNYMVLVVAGCRTPGWKYQGEKTTVKVSPNKKMSTRRSEQTERCSSPPSQKNTTMNTGK